MVPSPKIFFLCTYLKCGIVGFSNHSGVCIIWPCPGGRYAVKVEALQKRHFVFIAKIGLKCAKEFPIL